MSSLTQARLDLARLSSTTSSALATHLSFSNWALQDFFNIRVPERAFTFTSQPKPQTPAAADKRPIFLRLPAEIRLQILQLLLIASIPITPRQRQDRLAADLAAAARLNRVSSGYTLCFDCPLSSQVLQTCRQLFAEGVVVLYGGSGGSKNNNKFDLTQALRLGTEGFCRNRGLLGPGTMARIRHVQLKQAVLEQRPKVRAVSRWLKGCKVLELDGWEGVLKGRNVNIDSDPTQIRELELVIKGGLKANNPHTTWLMRVRTDMQMRGVILLKGQKPKVSWIAVRSDTGD